MSNTADHVGRPQQVEALGQTWTLGRWDRPVWAAFLDWASAKIPDPKKQAAELLAMIPKDDTACRVAVVEKALAESLEYLNESSPRVHQALDSLMGTAQLIYLLAKGNHPTMTEDLAYDIVVSAGKEQLQAKVKLCAGIPPQKKSPGNEINRNGQPNDLAGQLSTAP